MQDGTQPSDPLHQLVGFDRVHLSAGQQTQVPFPVDASVFSRVDEDGNRVTSPGEWVFTCEGASAVIVTA
jgi:beta-glucosidase